MPGVLVSFINTKTPLTLTICLNDVVKLLSMSFLTVLLLTQYLVMSFVSDVLCWPLKYFTAKFCKSCTRCYNNIFPNLTKYSWFPSDTHFVMLIIFLTEYEMCAQDTLELRWHFDCKSCQLRQVETQILKIETVNRKIQEDIDFMKKHSPLLEEKLNLEGEAVKDVLLAYEKVNTNHAKTFLLGPFH